MFVLFKKHVRVWFLASLGLVGSLAVVLCSLATPYGLMKFSLKDISPGKEMDVLSLVFCGFAAPFSTYWEGGGSYEEVLLSAQTDVKAYYYYLKKNKEGRFGYTIRKEVFPLAQGRLFVLNSILGQHQMYALPFSFVLRKETWDAVLFWDRLTDRYFLYLLRSYQNGSVRVYVFNQNPALAGPLSPEKDIFPFVWHPHLKMLGRELDLPGDFDIVWGPEFMEAHNNLICLIRYVSEVN